MTHPTFTSTFREWARRTTTSFAELRLLFSEREEELAGNGLIYKLKQWPRLPDAMRTAGVLRALSVMSSRPVNRNWILSQSRLGEDQVDALLRRLVDQDCVDVIDASKFSPAASRGE